MRYKLKLVSILVIASLIMSILPAGTYAVAAPSSRENIILEPDTKFDVEGFIETMNKELQDIYGIPPAEVGFTASTEFGKAKIYQVYRIKGDTEEFLGYTFAYGNPFGDKKTITTDKGKKTVYRYLGKALYSTKDPDDGFTNIEFPNDDYSGWTFPDLLPGSGYKSTFVEYPWLDPEVKIGKRLSKTVNNAFYSNKTATIKLKQQIVAGLVLVHPELVSKNLGPDGRVPAEDIKKLEQIPWEKYVHIYQPPTYSAWGMGAIWHRNRQTGKVWYKTIPIAPYSVVQSKYAIITAGFISDEIVDTIDIIETDKGDGYRYLQFMSDLMTSLTDIYKELWKHYDLFDDNAPWEEIEEIYMQHEDKILEAYMAVANILGEEGYSDQMVDHVLEQLTIYACLKAAIDTGRFTGRELEKATYLKYSAEGAFFTLMADLIGKYLTPEEAQKVIESQGSDLKELFGMDPRTFIYGTPKKIRDVYYAIKYQGNESIEELTKNQVGIAESLKNIFFNDKDSLGIVFFTTSTVGFRRGKNIPKSYLRNLANYYVQDIVEDMVNFYNNNNLDPRDSAYRVAQKWFTDKNLLDWYKDIELYTVVNSDGLSYGNVDSNGKFRYIKFNEGTIGHVFNMIARDVMKYGSNRTYYVEQYEKKFESLMNSSNELTSVEDFYASTEVFDDDNSAVGKEVIKNFGFDTRETAPFLTSGNVNSFIKLAMVEAGSRTNVNLAEKVEWGAMDIHGEIAITLMGFDRAIPIDLYIVSEETESGEPVILGKRNEYAYAVPNFKRAIPIMETLVFTDPRTGVEKNVKVTKAVIKPAKDDIFSFLDKVSQAEANGLDYVLSGNTKSIIEKPPFSFRETLVDTYTNVALTAEGTNFILMTATSEDEETYERNNNMRPAVVVYIEPGEQIPLTQVDVVEDSQGNTLAVNFKTPRLQGNNVILSAPAGTQIREWIVSEEQAQPFDETLTWANVQRVRAISSGDGSRTPVVDTTRPQIIYVRYVMTNNNVNVTGDITLSQKRITKVFDLSGFGLQTFNFIYSSAGYHTHRDEDGNKYDVPRRDPVETRYKYVIDYSKNLNSLAIAQSNARYAPRFKGTNIKEGTARWNGGSDSVRPNLYFIAWRGKDLPTLASYKESSNHPLLALGLKIGHTPQTQRNTQGGYKDKVANGAITLSKSANGDYTTEFACEECGNSRTQTHNTSVVAQYDLTLGVQSYIGSPNEGNAVPANSNGSFTVNGVTFNNAAGYAIPHQTKITFYPYVQMAYDIFENGEDNANYKTYAVNVLAQHPSTIQVNDYVEVGWHNPSPQNSLVIESNMWSTHARAVNAYGKNNVLPGGALYSLRTNNATKVAVRTWQVYIPESLRGYVTSGNQFSYNRAVNAESNLAQQIRDTLDTLDVVQFVSNNPNADNAFSGIELLNKGGQDVYGVKTSSYDKYWLRRGTPKGSTAPNEADLDIVNETKSTTIYRVRADVNGNIYVEKSTNGGASWSTLDTLSKTEGVGALANAEARELDAKTKIVTNFVLALDRNKGNDTTVSNGPTWYNEAWDGIHVLKTERVFTIGFRNPSVRSVVLDPKLTPPSQSLADVFTKYRLSQFKLARKSSIRANKPEGFVGNYEGRDIILPNFDKMYMSRRFWIPNATVMDLD